MPRALIFPGQGAQYVGMGKDLAAASPAAAAVLREADAVLGLPLAKIMAEGPADELTRTDISQPAILTASWMAVQAVEAKAGHRPAAVAMAGLSLGEYTALLAAGALDFADALRLVRLRGQAMQAAAEAVPGGMVALIGGDEAAASALCAECAGGEVLAVANLNSPGQVVISGAKAACERAVAAAKGKGFRRAMPLPVAGAFHSPLMAPAAERLRAALAGVRFRDPVVPVYANVSAEAVRSAAQISDLLVRQLTSPVRWQQSLEALRRDGVDAVLELGPGKTLCGMVERTIAGTACRNVDTAADLAGWSE